MICQQVTNRDSVHQVFDAVDAISVQGYDEERRVIYWNMGSELLYGYTKEEALGRRLEELIVPAHMCDRVVTDHRVWIDQGRKISAAEITLHDKNGEDVYVFSSHIMLSGENNEYEMYCVDINLAEVRKATASAAFKENMLKAVFEAIPDIFFLVKEDGTIVECHGSKKNLHVSPRELIGETIGEILPEKMKSKFKKHVAKVKKQGGVSSFEYELSKPFGKAYFEARLCYLQPYNQIMIIVRDITEQHKSAEVIRQQAYFDALTLLPNRFLSLDRFSRMIEQAKRNGEKTAVLFLDLDDFKKVNDTLGHETGDKLLVEASNRLKYALRKADTVGRLGGDEFIVLLQYLKHNRDADDVARNLLSVFSKPFDIDGRELILTVSIGIAIYPENGTSASDLLRNADIAMYRAKELGRNRYSHFTDEMNVIMLRRMEIEGQLLSALERNEFEVHYQPKFDVKTEELMGAEALIRWINPVLGEVSPDEFIPIAEYSDLIVPIGEYVIRTALEFLNEWQRINKKQYTVAVNLSPRQFRDKTLVSFIKKSLKDANISPDCLELEITEGVLMMGKSYIGSALDEIHDIGVLVSMDDFGTGYSSLSYLREYAFNVLKIDQSFIKNINFRKEDRDLVKASIAMAHSLGLLVVAEGVEDREQLTLLKKLGCDLAQGFYFSKAIRAEALIDFSKEMTSQAQWG